MNEAKTSISSLDQVSSDFGNVLFQFFLVNFEISYTRPTQFNSHRLYHIKARKLGLFNALHTFLPQSDHRQTLRVEDRI
jgi:hypothetical protein